MPPLPAISITEGREVMHPAFCKTDATLRTRWIGPWNGLLPQSDSRHLHPKLSAGMTALGALALVVAAGGAQATSDGII